jgi:hypothetical protein
MSSFMFSTISAAGSTPYPTTPTAPSFSQRPPALSQSQTPRYLGPSGYTSSQDLVPFSLTARAQDHFDEVEGTAHYEVMSVECKGVKVHWTPGSVWSTYPYCQHEYFELPWEPIAFENKEWLCLRSRDCTKFSTGPNVPCRSCMTIPTSEKYTQFVSRAVEAPGHTPWKFLSHSQLESLAQNLLAKNRQLLNKACTTKSYFQYLF